MTAAPGLLLCSTVAVYIITSPFPVRTEFSQGCHWLSHGAYKPTLVVGSMVKPTAALKAPYVVLSCKTAFLPALAVQLTRVAATGQRCCRRHGSYQTPPHRTMQHPSQAQLVTARNFVPWLLKAGQQETGTSQTGGETFHVRTCVVRCTDPLRTCARRGYG